MKRLLLIAALVAPTWLYSCMPKSVVPEPSVVIQETFDKLPIPEVREIPLDVPSVAPVLPSYKPTAKPRDSHRAAPQGHPTRPVQRPVPKPLPRVRPPAAEAPVAESEAPLPPQQGVICIFPFSMVPNCTPEPAGRIP